MWLYLSIILYTQTNIVFYIKAKQNKKFCLNLSPLYETSRNNPFYRKPACNDLTIRPHKKQ